MWEMSADSNTGFHKDQILASALNRHSISFQLGDMNSSCGKILLGNSVSMNNTMNRNTLLTNPTIINKAPTVVTPSATGLPLNSVPGLNPDVELAVEWSPEEQAVLEEGLAKYADEPNILKYIKISATLPEKTVRDVALRCRWMTKKESGKRRKPEDHYTGKKMKDRKEKAESSSKSSIPAAPPLNMGAYSIMMHHRDQNDRISCEGIGGTTRHLLDENAQVFSHITANLATFKVQENIDLFCRTRNNISAIINDMRAMPGIMSQMPPLPVSVNEELANIILPNSAQTMIFGSPTTIYQKPEPRC